MFKNWCTKNLMSGHFIHLATSCFLENQGSLYYSKAHEYILLTKFVHQISSLFLFNEKLIAISVLCEMYKLIKINFSK